MQPPSPRCRTQWLGISLLLLTCSFGYAQQNPSERKGAGRSEAASNLVQSPRTDPTGPIRTSEEPHRRSTQAGPVECRGITTFSGIVDTNEKNYSQAEEAFQQALRIDPGSKTTHNNLGNLYVAQQKLDLAEKEFNTVLKTAPTNRDANYNLGLLLMAKGSPLLAISHFQQIHPQTWKRDSISFAHISQRGKPLRPRTSTPTFCRAQAGCATAFHARLSTRRGETISTRRSLNWSRPTPCIPKRLRSFTISARHTCADMNMPRRISP